MAKVKLTMHIKQNSEIKSSHCTEKSKNKSKVEVPEVKKFTIKYMASISTTVSQRKNKTLDQQAKKLEFLHLLQYSC